MSLPVAARVRLMTLEVGTIVKQVGHEQFQVLVAGNVRNASVTEILEIGEDVKFRCAKYAKLHGVRFVSMSSLAR